MGVDRLPDNIDDPSHAADTTRLTEPPQPEKAAPEPEAERRTADHQRPPERQPERDPKLGREPEPEREQPTDSRRVTITPAPAPPVTEAPNPPNPALVMNTPTRLWTAPTAGRIVRGNQQQKPAPTRSRSHSTRKRSTATRGSPYDDSIDAGGKKVEAARPRTEQERAEHISSVFARLDKADAEGSSTNELHTIDPKGEIWSTDRTLLHHSLLDEIYARAADVPCDHEAIVAGGLSGAGKSTVLANHPDIDRSKYLTINPDNFKEEMARRGMIPEVEGLSPMEASELAHEESSYLARQLAIRAQAEGKNLIWDITMSDQAKTEQRILDLREAGYTKIQALFVQIPIETSLKRTEARYWENMSVASGRDEPGSGFKTPSQ